MYREECHSYSSALLRTVLAAVVLYACACINPAGSGAPAFTFGVIDVGEGLAQIAQYQDSAVLVDIGPVESYEKWRAAYNRCGEPFVRALVISHQHADHYGGLEVLDSAVRWSGRCIVGPYEDTAVLRGIAASYWKDLISFQIISAGDTLMLPGHVAMRCLWPDTGLGDSVLKDDSLYNRCSLVLIARHGESGLLVCSDIDTAAERALCLREKEALHASLFVVPHHGSIGSLSAEFYGYVRPETAVISCGIPNPYGHPSDQVLLWLSQMGVTVDVTSAGGTCLFESNGYYWQREGG